MQTPIIPKDRLSIDDEDPIYFLIESNHEEMGTILEYLSEMNIPYNYDRVHILSSNHRYWIKILNSRNAMIFRLWFPDDE